MWFRELDLGLAFGIIAVGAPEGIRRSCQMVHLGSCDLGQEDYFVELASGKLMGSEDALVGCLVDLWG
jgi:hypothetical protein